MALTAKQEAFAQALADGMTQADAYRKAYSVREATTKSVHELASKLAKNAKVASRIDALKGKLEEKALWSREKSVAVLAEIAAGIESRAGEKVAAVKELNAMHGFNEPAKLAIQGAISVIERRIVRP